MTRVVVTGSEGFIGKHTVQALKAKNYEVVEADIKSKTSSDICNPLFVDSLARGDKVLHLAAISTFSKADKDPLEAVRVNVQGTLNVARACVAKGVDRIVYASTGSVYWRNVSLPIDEDQRVWPESIYGLTKLQGERWIEHYAEKLPYIILRYAYIYGPGKDWGAVGSWIKKLKGKKSPVVFGGYQQNDFIYVGDVVQANIAALEAKRPAMNHIYNIGTGVPLRILDVCRMCIQAVGANMSVKLEAPSPFEMLKFYYNIKKAVALLKWTPKWKMDAALKDLLKRWTGK